MMDMALVEFNRIRHFDTVVREECLGVAFKYVYLYFYLLSDGLFVYSKNEYIKTDNFLNQIGKNGVIAFLLFRFWKTQIGSSGLVVSKSIENVSYLKNKIENILKRFNDNFMFGIKFNIYTYADKIKDFILDKRIEERDNKIKKIL